MARGGFWINKKKKKKKKKLWCGGLGSAAEQAPRPNNEKQRAGELAGNAQGEGEGAGGPTARGRGTGGTCGQDFNSEKMWPGKPGKKSDD